MQQFSNQDIGVIGSPSTNTEITTDLLLVQGQAWLLRVHRVVDC